MLFYNICNRYFVIFQFLYINRTGECSYIQAQNTAQHFSTCYIHTKKNNNIEIFTKSSKIISLFLNFVVKFIVVKLEILEKNYSKSFSVWLLQNELRAITNRILK